jgi:hypothetical protein
VIQFKGKANVQPPRPAGIQKMDIRKDKVIPKTGIKRTRTRLIVFMFSVMLAEYFVGCSQAPKFIPEELNGKYSATYPGYENQFFELGTELITMGFSGGTYKYYNIKKVEKEMIDNRILYTILCGNEDEGEEFNFAFFTDFAGKGIIYFKNKPQVAWKKTRNRNILQR